MLETNVPTCFQFSVFSARNGFISPLHKISVSHDNRKGVESGSVHLRILCAVELLSDELLGFDFFFPEAKTHFSFVTFPL
jgi:hypothetical protein